MQEQSCSCSCQQYARQADLSAPTALCLQMRRFNLGPVGEADCPVFDGMMEYFQVGPGLGWGLGWAGAGLRWGQGRGGAVPIPWIPSACCGVLPMGSWRRLSCQHLQGLLLPLLLLIVLLPLLLLIIVLLLLLPLLLIIVLPLPLILLAPPPLLSLQLYTGGSVGGAALINEGQADVVCNWSGGMHHAKKGEASGGWV